MVAGAKPLNDFMLTRILIGIGMIVIGYFMAAKTNWFLDLLGPVEWAERHFVSDGSRLFYKLLAIVIIIFGIIVVTDLYDSIVGGFIALVF
ncbi:MAG: hypothetical protein QG626_358 [Patescibacteria group bacterium]|nr:hypothetical protein [Patescibacteria group bacterium]